MSRAWCYAEWMWGRDNMLVLPGLNDLTEAVERELAVEFSGFVGRIL